MSDTSSFLFANIDLAIQGLLGFHINFRSVFSTSVKNAIGILVGITLNVWTASGSIDILTI